MTTKLSSPRKRGSRIMKNLRRKKTVQEIQDEIFRKMTFERKIYLLGRFSHFCRDLSQLRTSNKVNQKETIYGI